MDDTRDVLDSDIDTALERSEPQATTENPTLLVHMPRRPAVPVEVGEIIGRGGTAVVRRGVQTSLKRTVAVKRIEGPSREAEDEERLVREARIASALEHPNIIAVHDLVYAADGRPEVLLKHVDGKTWAVLLSESAMEPNDGAEQALESHLEVLATLCKALAFVHERGFLHRDLKPSNVMIGRFGEVYLLDWGLACEIASPERSNEEVSGTWAYAAPEQLAPDGAALGPWTDTYLLGAALFEVLAGRPPHAGSDLARRRRDATSGVPAPDLPTRVDSELAALVRRALDPDTSRRMRTPEQFGAALASYRRHRLARRLMQAGEAAMSRAGREADVAGDETALDETALDEAGFAFRMALKEWPECGPAQDGLRQIERQRVERCLASGDLVQAQRLVDAGASLPPELAAKLEGAVQAARRNAEQLQRIVADQDRSHGHGARGIVAALVGAVWVAFWAAASVLDLPPSWMALFCVAFFAGGGLVVSQPVAAAMLESAMNRRTVMLAGASLVASALWCFTVSQLELGTHALWTGLLTHWMMFAAAMGTFVDRWGLVSAVGFALALLAVSLVPSLVVSAVLASLVILLVNQVVLNRALSRRGFARPPMTHLGVPAVAKREARRS